MKKFLLKKMLLTVVVLLCSVVASAYDFQVDWIYYNVTSETDLTVEVTSGKESGDVVIPDKVSYRGNSYSVTSIGSEAFQNCSRLKSVTIPNSVTSIGSKAFDGCSDLTSVTIPNSVTSIGERAFRGCSDLTSITIPNSVTSIGDETFSRCSSLTSVTIPNCVTSIGICAFYGCSNLTSVTIGNSVTSIKQQAFDKCTRLKKVIIGKSVTSIEDSAFYECTWLRTVINLSSLKISKGDTGNGCVGKYADKVINAPNGLIEGDFVWAKMDSVNTLCIYLGNATELVLPENYKGENYVIGDYAFGGCSDLTSITIPNSVTSIGSEAFIACSGLKSVTIGSGVTSIGSDAFNVCRGLKEVHISDLVAWCNINFVAEYNSMTITNPLSYAGNLYLNGELVKDLVIPECIEIINNHAFYGCSGLTSVTIPNSVTSIGEYAFCGCSGLTSVTIPNSVTSIESLAFSGCDNLASVTIPNSVTSIGSEAFAGCSGLKSVTIGSGVTSIGYEAFRGCRGLTSIEIPNSVTSIGSEAFYNCSGLTSVTIGSGVTSIGSDAFEGCDNIVRALWLSKTPPEGYKNLKGSINYVVNDGYTELENMIVLPYLSSAFEIDGILYVPTNLTKRVCDIIDYSGTNDTVIINGTVNYKGVQMAVENMLPYSFYNAGTIDYLSINCNTIGENCFVNCDIKNLSINCDTIGENCFLGSDNIETITFGEKLSSIGDNVLSSCNKLQKIYCNATTPPTCGTSVFESADKWSCELYVPAASVADYQAANVWNEFFLINEIPTGIEEVTDDAPAIKVTAGGITLSTAEGKAVAVYTAAGALIEKIDCYAGEEITLDKGVYIIKIGNNSLKIKL